VYGLAPRWAAYSSLVAIALAMAAGAGKVIPSARRLASGEVPPEEQTRLVHGVFTAHVLLFVCILVLGVLQLLAAVSGRP
jgi:hypothetical protein